MTENMDDSEPGTDATPDILTAAPNEGCEDKEPAYEYEHVLVKTCEGKIVKFVNYGKSVTMKSALSTGFSDATFTEDRVPVITLMSDSTVAMSLTAIDKILSIKEKPPGHGEVPAIRSVLQTYNGADMLCTAVAADYLQIPGVSASILRCLADRTRRMSVRDMNMFFGSTRAPVPVPVKRPQQEDRNE